ncbi:murein hydrolase activator EnvC family protein [Ornithinibacillus contaminans]|uniref:murein hydrolase activator EnvC family protein n=1 Tax=Ornithinibacillus contaminans TaxID=694055 RepID=UPI00064DD09F|nr:peptidoglycan DD-metalloendopeptidase family protein [Ornithinibacillus contaminans]
MKKKVGIGLLIGLLTLSSVSIDWSTVSAQSKEELQQEIKELEKEQLQLNEEKEKLQGSKNETEQKINENLNKQASVQEQIDALDQELESTKNSIQAKQGEIDATNKEINALKVKIEDLTNQIAELEDEIEVLMERIKEREALLADRLRSIQKSGGSMVYLEVLLGSTSFSDFITRTAAVNIMMDQDKAIMDSLANDKQQVESKKVAVEDNKTEIEDKKVKVEDQKVALEDQKKELVALENQLDDQKAERQTLMAQLEEEHHHLEEYMFTLEDEQAMLNLQAQAKEKAKQLAQSELQQLSKPAAGNGTMIWPANGRLSSKFSYRVDPVTGVPGDFHLGIDIANSVGTPVYAATSGVAVKGNLSWTYGNHILVVNDDFTTLYAHLNGFAIENGQVVKQGDLIGYMGSTGNSTGPHLHFEVHKGGWIGFYPPNSNVVNPLNYLP